MFSDTLKVNWQAEPPLHLKGSIESMFYLLRKSGPATHNKLKYGNMQVTT